MHLITEHGYLIAAKCYVTSSDLPHKQNSFHRFEQCRNQALSECVFELNPFYILSDCIVLY